MLFPSHGHGAEDPSRGQALGADELGFLFFSHMRRAADLVVGVSPVPAIGPGALDFPLDEDALEGGGVELGEHALEGGFLGMIIAAAPVPVAAQRAALERGELGGEGGQVALAAHDACQGGHDHGGQQAVQGVAFAFFRSPVIGQTLAAQREHAAGEIGAIRSGQNEEAGVGHARVLRVRRENLQPITSKN